MKAHDTKPVIELAPYRDPLTGEEVWAVEPPGQLVPASGDRSPAILNPTGEVTTDGAAVRLPTDRFAGTDPVIDGGDWSGAQGAIDSGRQVVLSPSGQFIVVDGDQSTPSSVTLPSDRFAARKPAPTLQVWTITDEALTRIDLALAAPDPERGGALISPIGQRLIVDVVLDPVAGGAAEYWHSPQLHQAVQDYLRATPGVTYGGSIHSHPVGMATPSDPDRTAFASAIRGNPHIRELLFPIVVNRQPTDLARCYRGEHVVATDHGSVAAFTAVADGPTSQVIPVHLRVLPLREHANALAARMGITAGSTSCVLGHDGSAWLSVPLTGQGTEPVHLLFPGTYPLSPPLVFHKDSGSSTSPAWDPAGDAIDQIAAHVSKLVRRPAASPDAQIVRDGIRARLPFRTSETGRSHVAVIGAGSVGSVAAEMLVRSGVTQMTLIDPDVVEAANLSRTVYQAADLGRTKVRALSDRLMSIAPDVDVTAIPDTVRVEHIADVDAVLLATDDPWSELLVGRELYRAGIPMVSAKLFAKAEAGELIIVDPGSRTPCLRCLTASRAPGIAHDADYGTGRLRGELALGPDIAGVAHRAVKVLLALLARRHGGGLLADWIAPMIDANRTLHLSGNVDGWGIFGELDMGALDGPYASVWVRTQRSPDCPVCAPIAAFDDDPVGVLAAIGRIDDDVA